MGAEINTALLTGTFALAGVALSITTSALLSWWDKNQKRKILLREKYEELSFHFLDSIELPQKLAISSGKIEELLPLTHQVHSNKAHMLAILYFNELQEPIEQYREAYTNLCVVSQSLYNPNNKLVLGEQVYNNPEYIRARDAFITSRDHLNNQIQFHAGKYAAKA